MPEFRARDCRLTSGEQLPELTIAYEVYGTLSPNADNAILVFHGLTSSHLAVAPITLDKRHGWWSNVIGAGKVFDTDRFAVISSNMLGSCYGSTGPASINPGTGRPYAIGFPQITFDDIIRAQQLLLQSMGIEQLLAVAGTSYGGYLAFQWATALTDATRCVIAMDTAPRDIFDSSAVACDLQAQLAKDPAWNGGHPADSRALVETLTGLRYRTLVSYGLEAQLQHLAAESRQSLLTSIAREWAEEFDAIALLRLWQATAHYNTEDRFPAIHVPLLYILADSDTWFPVELGKAVMARLMEAGADARFLAIHSPHGHYASTMEPETWAPAVRALLDEVRP